MAKQKCSAYRRGETEPVECYALPAVDIEKDDLLFRDATNPHYVTPISGLVGTRAAAVAKFVGIAVSGVKATDENRGVSVATRGCFMYPLKAAAQLNVGDLLTISDDGTNLVNQEVIKTTTAAEALFVVSATTGHPDFDWSGPPAVIAAADLSTKDEVEGRLLGRGVLEVDLIV